MLFLLNLLHNNFVPEQLYVDIIFDYLKDIPRIC